MKRRRFPLNVAGDFYVESGICMACQAPEAEAPGLMTHEEGSGHCYFVKQPATSGELEQAIMAAAVSCCQAVRYAGSEPQVLRRLAELDSAASCDQG